ncbi:hypothetical protein HMN09_00746800 [Mycena chlorophos]|uniref:Uncharacterized protein n=1 Tax=Mycena chlorophos TaxID=658473 RepID=A0A8H6W7L3_MYCCL|nr:hypothetical protein HMN09_00746800 [Mycena chlorophos]
MNSSISKRSSKRFSLLNVFQRQPKYPCQKCKIVVHDLGEWLEHLGHDPVSDALVLNKMDTFVNETPTPDQDLEKPYFDESDSDSSTV